MGHFSYDFFYGRESFNHKLFMLLNHADLPVLDAIMPLITMLGSSRAFYVYFALLTVFYIADKKLMPGRYLVVYAAATMLALLVEYLLKEFFHVPRPALAIGAENIRILGELKKYNGLPSGHAVFSFMSAFVLSAGRNRRWKLVLFFFATLVAYSRIYMGAHYPVDVLAGAGVGIGCGYFVWASYGVAANKIKRRTPAA